MASACCYKTDPDLLRKTGKNESFKGALRREVLNAERFTTPKYVGVVITPGLRLPNHPRLQQEAGMRPPVSEKILEKVQINGPEGGVRHLYVTHVSKVLGRQNACISLELSALTRHIIISKVLPAQSLSLDKYDQARHLATES